MFKKFYLFLTLLTAFLWLGSGSAWGDPISIDADHPYTNNFDDGSITGWTHTGTGGDMSVESKSDFATRNNSAKSLKLQVNKGKNYRAILPQFSDDIQYLTVSFYAYKGSNKATYSVGYVSGGVYTSKKSFTPSTSWGNVSYTFDNTAPEGALIAIQIVSGETSGTKKSTLLIEDVTVTTSYVAPTGGCANPTLGTPTILPDGVTLTWTAGGEETDYQYACVAKNATPESWTDVPGTELTLTLHGLTAGTSYDLYVRSDCGTEQSSGAKVNFTPVCPAPTAPQISNIGTTTADLSWTAASGITTYQYVTAISGQTPNWENAQTVSATSAQLTGLQPGKTYKAYVRSYYSATSISSAVETSAFQTECAAVGLPYEETFDAANPCWKLEHCHGSTGVTGGRFRFYYTSSYPQYLISPEIEESANPIQVEFEYQNSSNTYAETFKVGYSTTTKDVDAFTWGDEYTANDNTKVLTYSDVLPAGIKYIAIQCTSNNAYFLYIDNFTVTEYVAPACAAPTALAVSEIGTNSAKVTWTSDAANFALEYKKTSDENWTAATGTIASGIVLSGLTANQTEYTVRVQAICGETPSDWVELADPFKTDCETKELGWSEDFDAATVLPACWTASSWGSSDNQWYYYAYGAHSGSNQLRWKGKNASTGDLTTPSVIISDAAQLTFWYNGTLTNTEVYMTDGIYTDKIFTVSSPSSTAWKQATVVLPDSVVGKTLQFIFRGKGSGISSAKSIYIDDVAVIVKPCDAPDFADANVTATPSGATISCAADTWKLRYRENGVGEWNESENITEETKAIACAFGKEYEVQVKAVCSATRSSEWTASQIFTPSCSAPTTLVASAITYEGANVTWTGNAKALRYKTGTNDWTPVTLDPVAESYAITGLDGSTTYQVAVQAECALLDDEAWTDAISFTTKCDPLAATALPLNESFASTPACWEFNFAGGYSQATNNYLTFSGTAAETAILPLYDIELKKLSVTVTTAATNLQLGYVANHDAAFQPLATIEGGTEIVLGEISLLNADTKGYLVIRYPGGTYDYTTANVSNVYVRKTPTCTKPVMGAIDASYTTVSINWDNTNAEAWNLQYKTGSADWTTISAITEKPYTLEGLTQGTTYKVRVQGACDDEDSDWSEEAQFTTNCETIAAIPFDETFDAALSNCWNITDENISTYAHSVYGSELRLPGGKAASGHLVVLPEFSVSLANATMTIEYSATAGANTAVPQVGYIDGDGNFQQLEALVKSNTKITARVALGDATTGKMALRYDDGTSEGNFDIASIRVSRVEVFNDNDDNIESRLANLVGETIDDFIFNRTLLGNGDYNTFCLPFSLDADQLAASPIADFKIKAFDYAAVENEELLIAITNASAIEAGVPYFIANTNPGANLTEQIFHNVVITADAPANVADGDITFQGVFNPVDLAAQNESDDHDKLFLAAGNTIYWPAQDKTVKGFRAYFNVVTGNTGPLQIKKGMPARIVERTQMPTGVENTNIDAPAVKLIENGTIIILRNGVKYTIQGQKIQ